MYDYEDCLPNKSENSEPQWRLNLYYVLINKVATRQCQFVKESWADMVSYVPISRCYAAADYAESWCLCPVLPLQAEHSLLTVFNNKWIPVTLPDSWGWIIKGNMTSACCFLFQTEHGGSEPRGFYFCLLR